MGRRLWSGAALACGCFVASVSTAQAAAPDCRAYLRNGWRDTISRPIQADDLVRLRDLGSNGGFSPDAKAVTLSPDGRMLAFQLRRADPERNRYCLGMFVLPLHRGASPVLVDTGGELIRATYDFNGKAAFLTGVAATITPRWTPDGRAILFLKRIGGRTQVWEALADGSSSHQITASTNDILDFRVTPDGATVVYQNRPALRLSRMEIMREGLSGYHYDDRYSPMSSSRPFVRSPVPKQTFAQSISRPGVERPASATERALFETSSAGPAAQIGLVRSSRGDLAWLEPSDDVFPPKLRVHVRTNGGQSVVCLAQHCSGAISDLWWTRTGTLRYFRREGWSRESTAIYEWRPGNGAPRRIFATTDELTSCTPVPTGMICVRESSTNPRYISRIDLHSGHETRLFDPNPEFRSLRLGQVERLHWRNDKGLEVFGDLVLPLNYRRGTKYPLIIVQYESRGFLRGGTGDEYPIQAFAADGYAVLSFNRPRDIGILKRGRSAMEVNRLDLADFADRKSVQSALQNGISLLVHRGIVDPQRIGITGVSDGASTAQYALLNSDLFKAAALSSCCWDWSLSIEVGPGAMSTFSKTGYPGILSQANPFWDRISLAKNAARIDTPILLQLADAEYMSALTAYAALSDADAPVDMYVFPGETHVKWQPAHRLAIYRRSLAWFDYWLLGKDSTMVPADELARWKKLRARADLPAAQPELH